MSMNNTVETVRGTCQACFGIYALTGAQRMVHHGYQRPGFGYIVGDCGGVHEAPYELSCEYTKVWADQVHDKVSNLKRALDNLRSGATTSLVITKTLTKYSFNLKNGDAEALRAAGWTEEHRRGYGRSGNLCKKITFTVTPGHVPSAERGETHYNDWDSYLGRAIRETEQELKSWSDLLAMLKARIAAWVYAPEKLVLGYYEREARAAVEGRRAEKQAARQAKLDEKAAKAAALRAKAESDIPALVEAIKGALANEELMEALKKFENVMAYKPETLYAFVQRIIVRTPGLDLPVGNPQDARRDLREIYTVIRTSAKTAGFKLKAL